MTFIHTAFPVGGFPAGSFPILSFPGNWIGEEEVAVRHGGAWFKRKAELNREMILLEDEELMEFISILVQTELLN
jgi:hypothetical protein